jgi:outer membrane protein assembly factor BamB
MLVWGEHLYYVNDRGVAGCHVIKTGEEVWSPPKRLGGDFSASPILVDGKIYAVNEGGEVFVLEASPKYNLLHRTTVADSVFATPAVSDGKLIIRGQTKMFCYGK